MKPYGIQIRDFTFGLLVAGFLTVGGPSVLAQGKGIKWGAFDLSVGFSLGTDFTYTDNVNSSETNPKSEFNVLLNLGPSVTGGITLPFRLRGGQELRLETSISYTYKISLVQG